MGVARELLPKPEAGDDCAAVEWRADKLTRATRARPRRVDGPSMAGDGEESRSGSKKGRISRRRGGVSNEGRGRRERDPAGSCSTGPARGHGRVQPRSGEAVKHHHLLPGGHPSPLPNLVPATREKHRSCIRRYVHKVHYSKCSNFVGIIPASCRILPIRFTSSNPSGLPSGNDRRGSSSTVTTFPPRPKRPTRPAACR